MGLATAPPPSIMVANSTNFQQTVGLTRRAQEVLTAIQAGNALLSRHASPVETKRKARALRKRGSRSYRGLGSCSDCEIRATEQGFELVLQHCNTAVCPRCARIKAKSVARKYRPALIAAIEAGHQLSRITLTQVRRPDEPALDALQRLRACLARFGTLRPDGATPVIRSDNGLIFQSKRFRAACKDYRLSQEFVTPYTPEQNGMIERFFRSLKEECVWLENFTDFEQARAAVAGWIRFYNSERPHQSLNYMSPEQFRAQQANQVA